MNDRAPLLGTRVPEWEPAPLAYADIAHQWWSKFKGHRLGPLEVMLKDAEHAPWMLVEEHPGSRYIGWSYRDRQEALHASASALCQARGVLALADLRAYADDREAARPSLVSARCPVAEPVVPRSGNEEVWERRAARIMRAFGGDRTVGEPGPFLVAWLEQGRRLIGTRYRAWPDATRAVCSFLNLYSELIGLYDLRSPADVRLVLDLVIEARRPDGGVATHVEVRI